MTRTHRRTTEAGYAGYRVDAILRSLLAPLTEPADLLLASCPRGGGASQDEDEVKEKNWKYTDGYQPKGEKEKNSCRR